MALPGSGPPPDLPKVDGGEGQHPALWPPMPPRVKSCSGRNGPNATPNSLLWPGGPGTLATGYVRGGLRHWSVPKAVIYEFLMTGLGRGHTAQLSSSIHEARLPCDCGQHSSPHTLSGPPGASPFPGLPPQHCIGPPSRRLATGHLPFMARPAVAIPGAAQDQPVARPRTHARPRRGLSSRATHWQGAGPAAYSGL